MARQPTGPPPPPVVQRLRIKYAKRGRLRFTSHRDFQRAFERALRRGQVPMAYSAGFSPHPRISYAGAAPTGAASEAEYLEIAVTAWCDPAALARVLDSALPAGLDVLEVVEAATADLAGRLQASVWEIQLPGVSVQAATAAVTAFLAAEAVEVERLTKHGMRVFDARGAVLALTVTPAGEQVAKPDLSVGCAILTVVVRHTTPAVRPDDVLAGLRRVADLAPPTPALVVRLAQGPLDAQGGAVTDPLAPDRDAAATAGAEAPTSAGSATR
ncbi:MAG TPA: TIGR03936 family radical SAM-associated protein [Actinomycetes bacterium]|nr:TIGR03936 family radical SAM-associated protein [Actinomycetes bacterium]